MKTMLRLYIAALTLSCIGCGKPAAAYLPGQPDVQGFSGTAYYVSTDGSDFNSGLSASSPLRTLAKAAGMIDGPGDAILLKRGDQWSGESLTLTDMAGTPDDPVTVSAYGSGDKPVIRHMSIPDRAAVYLENCSGVVIEDIRFEDNSNGIILDYPFRNGREHVRISGCDFEGGGTCVLISGDYQKDEPSDFDYNIKDILIEGCVSRGSETFLNCVYFSNLVQIDFDTYPIWDLKISDCDVRSTVKTAMLPRWTKGGYIDNCTMLNIYTGIAENGSAAVLLRRTRDFVIRNTEIGYVNRKAFEGADGEAIDFEGHVVECKVSDCYLHHCDGPAIMFFYTLNANGPVKYNKRNYILNNRFHHNNQSANHPKDCEIWIADPLRDPGKPTIISGNTYTRIPGVRFYLLRPGVTTDNIEFRNNTESIEAGLYEWQFNGSTSGIPAEGAHNDIVSITRFDTYVRLEVDADLDDGPPAFALDDAHNRGLEECGLKIDANSYKRIHVRIRNNTPARKLAVHWAARLDDDYLPADSKIADITTGDSEFSTCVFDLVDESSWSGTIEKVKLVWSDMLSGSGTVDIDNIKIVSD